MAEDCTPDPGEPDPVVFIVDDDAAMRDALEELLKATGFGTRSFSTAGEFLRAYDTAQPGCLILDVRMPGMDGPALQARLVSSKVEIPIIFLTGYGEVPTTAKAFKLGAVDFLEKPFIESAMLDAIGRALEADRVNRDRRTRQRILQALLDALTPRERVVLDRLVAGITTKQIAAELGVSGQAIDAHRQRLFRKAGVDNVAELIRFVLTGRSS